MMAEALLDWWKSDIRSLCGLRGGVGGGLVRLLLFTKEEIHPTKNAVCFLLFNTERR